MRIGRLVFADVAAQLAGLSMAVIGALLGWEYWALVAQVLTTAIVGLSLRWSLSGWMPGRMRRGHDNRGMIGDSAFFGFAQVLTYLSTNLDTISIGVRWSAGSLGAYTRAFQLLTAPLNSIMGPLTQVVIPTVNRARSEGKSVDSVLLRIQFALGVPILWIYAMSAATANWSIPFLLGPDWGSAIPIFQALAVGGLVWTFSRVAYWAFIADNLGRQLLQYNLVTKSMASVLILGASFISIQAVAWAVTIGLVASWPINLVWLARTSQQDSRAYWRNGLVLILAAVCGFATAWPVANYLDGLGSALAAMLAIIVGTITYFCAAIATPLGRRELGNAVALTRLLRPRAMFGR